MSRRPVLVLRDVSVRRGANTLLDQVAWQIEPGQHWALLGANGSGKTTLLKVLTGLMTPSRGRIELNGSVHGRTDWREVRLQIGLVSSALQAHVPPAEIAVETVISGRYDQLDLWVTPTPQDYRAARNLLAELQAESIHDRPWAYLSQGERQRVLIARALAAKPRLLILDEPCAGLDPVARTDFLETIDELARRGRGPTLVLVTHHVEEITPAFSHALLLRQGKVGAAGAVGEVLTSVNLSEVFGRRVSLRGQPGAWALAVERRPRD